ncbi:VPLPA-CTERM sorting domain-containing protein [Epibacterium sp. SM1969]|uniref:VPLPA-CTERM sorting domain-containing protein n=1 Tax=Tritonibacter aquimaris TaxID=2663379 RepID=A0A844AML8_9RHOB|nr:VPLPA-CTERM sorting domain-containing protein [Tritonibacter aquimaris]MQY41163.1 VPLPA-CTERM sorting domain-containing protein [Tritonibacter aquimaris]
MMKRILSVAVLVAMSTPTLTSAAVVSTFTDRASFEAFAGGVLTEDFNGVVGQPSFAGTPLTVGDLTLQTLGSPLSGERNAIDQPPFQFAEISVDGSALANVLLDSADDAFSISFAAPVFSFGADFGALNDNVLRTSVSFLDQTLFPDATTGNVIRFFGFTSDTLFDTVSFNFAGLNDGFSVDNVTFGGVSPSPVPLPAGLPLLLSGLGGLGLVLRRRRS